MADPIAQARAHVEACFDGLDLAGVTAKTAHARCTAALETLAANVDLITKFEKPRQLRVRQQRAQAAATKAGEAAQAAAAKQARIDRRKAFQ